MQIRNNFYIMWFWYEFPTSAKWEAKDSPLDSGQGCLCPGPIFVLLSPADSIVLTDPPLGDLHTPSF